MSSLPQIELHYIGQEPLARALAATAAPHLPQNVLSDHCGIANPAMRHALQAKITPLLHALESTMDSARVNWPGARADVLALDLAVVEHPQQPFALAWVEIQAFTSMLPTFHTMHLAHRQLGAIGAGQQPHDPLPDGCNWVDHVRSWVCPHQQGVLIEDRPRERFTWPDLDAARHWWKVDVHDWRDLIATDGMLVSRANGSRYRHVWNRLILPDLALTERAQAEALLRAAPGLSWHSHPAWYEGLHKGHLAGLPLAPHETCLWVEDRHRLLRESSDPAEAWVAKPVHGHSGEGVMMHPTTAQLAALPTPGQWILQRKFRQLPIGRHPLTSQPLFGEIRCMLGLRAGRAPWVMGWMLRCSNNGNASMTGRRTAPGEGMTLLYFDSLPAGS